MSKGLDKNASRILVTFIRGYTDLLQQNLAAIRDTMRETVDGVMEGIQKISDTTADKKKQANEVLVSTYTNPSDDARQTMDSVQDEVNRILEGAASATEAVPNPAETDSGSLRRSAGFFSKHMEALDSLDGEVGNLLVSMMGVLSRDDIIAQRIEHVAEALQALQMSLGYMLVDFEARCSSEDVERFARDLKSYLLRSYSSEEEKKLHFAVFPDEPKAS